MWAVAGGILRLWAVAALVGVVWVGWRYFQACAAEKRREKRLWEELKAYEQLDLRHPADGDLSGQAWQICRVVSEKSTFYRVGMLTRNVEGHLCVVGSTGMEDAVVHALNLWGRWVPEEERGAGSGHGRDALGIKVGNRSFSIVLRSETEDIGRVVIVPVRTTAGRMVGALALGADGLLLASRTAVGEALLSLEILAVRLGRMMENAALAERLLRAERLASLGLVAGELAHALNNPLTAVLGYAELIADTSDEVRVKTDAGMIVREALRMRRAVDVLREVEQPAEGAAEPVDMAALVLEMVEEYREEIDGRGVELMVQIEPDVPVVRGSRGRLRQMLEHLLNNAVEAVASADARLGEAHAICVTMSDGGWYVHLIVSDTGNGFKDPRRVFDPFYTTQAAKSGMGLGLGICRGIVQEHRGELNAFNLQPRGAAVAVELPFGEIMERKDVEEMLHASAVVSNW